MTDLFDLTKQGRNGTVSAQELVDVIVKAAEAGRGFGMAEAKDVVLLLDRCSPALSKDQLTRIRNSCQSGANKLSGSGRAYSIRDFEVVAKAAEDKLASA
jgi:hypothetical protein